MRKTTCKVMSAKSNCWLLAFGLLAGLVRLNVQAETQVWTFSDGRLTATLEDVASPAGAKALTISGTGDMTPSPVGSGQYPWSEQKGLLVQLTISEGVTSVGPRAFSSCYNLASVSLPTSLTNIEEHAFYGCGSDRTLGGLTSLTIPSGVTTIGEEAFCACTELEALTLPTKIPVLGDRAFCACWRLADKDGFVVVGNVLFNYAGEGMLVNPKLPSGIVGISSGAFAEGREYHKLYGDLVIPSGVTNIGGQAFSGCERLTSVTIPASVKSIGLGAFDGCRYLTEVSISEGVQHIAEYAFYECRSLRSVVIPSTVESVGSSAFGCCENLERVKISEGVKSLDGLVFCECTSLKSVEIPASMRSLGGEATFYHCVGLTSVTFQEGVTNLGIRAFARTGVGAVTIPSSVRAIDELAFESCGNLETVVIREGVERIDKCAFLYCTNLTLVTIPPSVKVIADDAFYGTGLKSVTIPAGVTEFRGFAGARELEQVEFEGAPPSDFTSGSIPHEAFIWYNARYQAEWEDVLERYGYEHAAPYKPCSCCRTVPEVLPKSVPETVTVVVTNIVVNYVLNSVNPAFALPASYDTGFVNIITEVRGACVAVPATWTVSYPEFTTRFGSDFTKALGMKTGKRDASGNDMFVWQDYVAGTDPTNPDDTFKASITVEGGEVRISYTPELDDARKALRKYTVWGKRSLLDKDWVVVQNGHEADYGFFKVTVEMR